MPLIVAPDTAWLLQWLWAHRAEISFAELLWYRLMPLNAQFGTFSWISKGLDVAERSRTVGKS